MVANMAKQWSEEELELYFIQVAKGDNYKFEILKNCKGCVTSSTRTNDKDCLEIALDLLEYLYKELQRREDLIMQSAKRSDEDFNLNIYNKQNPRKKMSALLLLIDEASSLFEVDASMGKEEKALRTRASRICQEIAKRGRSVGFNIIVCQQRATKDELPRAIKINCTNKLTFNQTDKSASVVAIDDEKAALGLLPQVFVYKSGSDKVFYGKTPMSNWTNQIDSIRSKGRIRKDDDDFIKSCYSDWMSNEITNICEDDYEEKVSIEQLSIQQEINNFRSGLQDFVYKNAKQQKEYLSNNEVDSNIEIKADNIKIKL